MFGKQLMCQTLRILFYEVETIYRTNKGSYKLSKFAQIAYFSTSYLHRIDNGFQH